MGSGQGSDVERREFLKVAGLATAGTLLTGSARAATTRVSVLIDPADPIASAAPARWAAEHLQQALTAHRITVQTCERLGDCGPSDFLIVSTGGAAAARLTGARELRVPDGPEALAIAPGTIADRRALFAAGSDVRGLVYALTELADVAALSSDPLAALAAVAPVAQKPANPIRSCMRMFCSDVEDTGWFRDKAFWNAYLSMLVGQRFNRVNLSLGLGYDFTTEIRDCYLHFAYPFLLDVPGYKVTATNLVAAERDANLEQLKFISDAAAARGLHFQLGLWTHAYEWTKSPDANHRIEGLTDATHGPYCRDALTQLLKACPNIAGVTFRIHGESGVAEGSYEFWKTVFDGVVNAGRPLEIDMHAKGMDQRMIEIALAAGLPLIISPKFWAEHMGLPYHQAWIRPTELPQRERGAGLFAQSSGSRSFLRYGYGDLLAEDRKYRVLHRIWPGTQRLLVWGDPMTSAAYGRASSFCGSAGCDLMEPLSFKGRKGSGVKGARTARADASLVTTHDFETYLYTYRLWGRLLYDPDSKPDTWQRLLRQQYGPAAPAVEGALAASGRILPLVTTAHTPSAANNHWWPEMSVNMSIVDASKPEPFTDTPVPKRFGAVSPLDPQMFSSVEAFLDELLLGASEEKPPGRYSPIEVATRLDALAADAAARLVEAQSHARNRKDPAFRRFAIDTAVVVDTGRFFALKFRAAALYALFERAGDRQVLARAVELYGAARQVWARIIERTTGVFADDVSFGIAWYQRGHWRDRLAAIDKDIAAMKALAAPRPASDVETPISTRLASVPTRSLMAAFVGPAVRPRLSVEHAPPASFRRGEPLTIDFLTARRLGHAALRYRHTNQAEPWRSATMEAEALRYSATIPAEYTATTFPLQYYFELVSIDPRVSTMYPGFDDTWCNQPYVVVRPTSPAHGQHPSMR